MKGGTDLAHISSLFHQIILFYRPFETHLNAILADHQLHRAQWSILYYLEKNDSITLVELAQLQGVEKPTVTRTVTKLEEAGLIKPIATHDKREKRIILTEQGRTLYHQVRIPIDAFEHRLLEGVSEEEQQQMIELLVALREKI